MADYEMLDNIKAHSLQVARLAVLLTRELEQAGFRLDSDLIMAGALLHDIAKTQCLNGACNHAKVGSEICLEHGFDAVAVIVAEHVIMADYDRPLSPVEIVYYADKRVRHDEIVSLNERQVYIEERYGQGKQDIIEAIRVNFAKCYDVEKRIFAKLPIHPDSVVERVGSSSFPF